MYDALGVRWRSVRCVADQQNLRRLADQRFQRQGPISRYTVAAGDVLEAGDLHQFSGHGVRAVAHSAGLIDRGGHHSGSGRRASRAMACSMRSIECFALLFPFQNRRHRADLGDAFFDGLRHVEQLEPDAHPACSALRVAMAEWRLVITRSGFSATTSSAVSVGVGQGLRDVGDRGAPGIAGVLAQRQDVFVRNELRRARNRGTGSSTRCGVDARLGEPMGPGEPLAALAAAHASNAVRQARSGSAVKTRLPAAPCTPPDTGASRRPSR